jgi:hypothetical protein
MNDASMLGIAGGGGARALTICLPMNAKMESHPRSAQLEEYLQ